MFRFAESIELSYELFKIIWKSSLIAPCREEIKNKSSENFVTSPGGVNGWFPNFL